MKLSRIRLSANFEDGSPVISRHTIPDAIRNKLSNGKFEKVAGGAPRKTFALGANRVGAFTAIMDIKYAPREYPPAALNCVIFNFSSTTRSHDIIVSMPS